MVKTKKPKNKEAQETLKQEKKEGGKYKIYGVKKKQDFIKVDKELPRPIETMLERGGGCLQIFSPPGSGIYGNIMSVPKEERQLSCIIFDDCMGSRAMRQHTLLNKMIAQNRHMKCLFVFSTQSVKSINPNLRSCCSHSLIFYQPSQKQMADITELHSFFGGEDEFIQNYKRATTPKYGFMLNDWRDLKSYAWGADLGEPELMWSRYDENGNVTEKEEPNKGLLKSD